MTSIFLIFTLATAALAKGAIECNFSELTGPRRCFGEAGQPLIFHLPNPVNPDIILKKDNNHLILKLKGHSVTMHEVYESFTSGILRLGKATKRHSGDYLLEEFGSDGKLLKQLSVHLEIFALVSKPAVSQMCLSPEQMNVSCSSEGGEVDFTLTLDGHLLLQTKGPSLSQSSWTINGHSEDKPGVSKVTISLYGQLTGRLMCRVQNNVSRDETTVHLTSCKGVSSFTVVTVAVTASVVTLVLPVLLCLLLTTAGGEFKDGLFVTEVVYTVQKLTDSQTQLKPKCYTAVSLKHE
ncbi:uncharacterized protein LOC119031424 [Acanthopagrus latus]|uniref:uncharacterized protein LOC119031424 n=1 Tax=Acanthopagrus latus TaxID=8177 RepID=UPI00187CC609|nr:uncharacterized protein LOC119031424 [Acanthopagrus latus]XP_036975779.1 uncharacterized protein LOC119031424 [Acanthopagrus latus]XP_036975780.1 uncharacterized protein LOC119031424 [Acanthopagrus latus]